VVEAARDLKKQIAEKGMPKGADELIASARRARPCRGKCAARSARIFVEVEVDTELGRAHVTKYVAVHDCGRIMNPLTARSQIKGGAIMGIGMALPREPGLRPAQRQPAVGRLLRRPHRDAPRRAGDRRHLHRVDDGLGRSARRAWGVEQGAGAGGGGQRGRQRDRRTHEGSADHARENSSRDSVGGEGRPGMKAFTNANPRDVAHAVTIITERGRRTGRSPSPAAAAICSG